MVMQSRQQRHSNNEHKSIYAWDWLDISKRGASHTSTVGNILLAENQLHPTIFMINCVPALEVTSYFVSPMTQ